MRINKNGECDLYMEEKKTKLAPATIVMIAVLYISFFSIGYQIVLKNVVVDLLGIKTEWVDRTISSLEGVSIFSPLSIDINWSMLYPFPEDSAYKQEVLMVETSSSGSVETDIINKIYSMFEKYSSNWYMFTDQCEIVSKSFNRFIGMNLITDAYGNLVFKLSDGRWTTEREYKDISAEVANVVAFSDYLSSQGIKHLYVCVPSPVDPDEEAVIIAGGYNCYSNQMADEVIDTLRHNEINLMDLRYALKEESVPWAEVFFSADHHWRPQYGLWGAEKIACAIDKIQNVESESYIFEECNYSVDNYKNVYLGAYGSYATTVYAEKDDMEIWYPLYDTDFVKTVPQKDLEMSGDFADVMYDMTVFPTYNTWNHGITGLKTYHNNNADAVQLKVLLITDSYSDVVVPFLASAYSDIEELDLRIFSGSVETYISENKPDIVVTIYSAYDFNSGEGNGLYSFK